MSNTELMRDGYARYSRRDFTFVDELFAPDIAWRTPGAEQGITGRDAVLGFFGELTKMFTAHEIVMNDAVESGDRLICFCRHHFTDHAGEVHEAESVMDWRFRDGQVASMREVADTLAFARATGMVPAAD